MVIKNNQFGGEKEMRLSGGLPRGVGACGGGQELLGASPFVCLSRANCCQLVLQLTEGEYFYWTPAGANWLVASDCLLMSNQLLQAN